MGDTKKFRKKYQSPSHPWVAKAIEEEKVLVAEYGLKKKQEIHIATSFLKKYKDIAKELIADKTEQGKKEKAQMMTKLHNLGLIAVDARLDDILRLQLKDILERRVQSQVFRHGMAKTANQSRQFIVHGHITSGEQPITFPSHLLTLQEEASLMFKPASVLAAEDHPERAAVAAAAMVQEEKEKVMAGNKPSGKGKKVEEEQVGVIVAEAAEPVETSGDKA